MNDTHNARVSLGLEVIAAIASLQYRVSDESIAEIMVRLERYNRLLPLAPDAIVTLPEIKPLDAADPLDAAEFADLLDGLNNDQQATLLDAAKILSVLDSSGRLEGLRSVTVGWLEDNSLSWYNAIQKRVDLPRAFWPCFYPDEGEVELYEVVALSKRRRDSSYEVWFYAEETGEIESVTLDGTELMFTEDK